MEIIGAAALIAVGILAAALQVEGMLTYLAAGFTMMLLASYSAPNAPRESPAQCVVACGARKGSSSRVSPDFQCRTAPRSRIT